MARVRILILEDDTKTLSLILNLLSKIEEKFKDLDFQTTILPDYIKVKKYINYGNEQFDLILLDRDCGLGGSFHTLDLDKYDKDSIIAISSVPEYNQQLVNKGVYKIVGKNYEDLEDFINRLQPVLETSLEQLF